MGRSEAEARASGSKDKAASSPSLTDDEVSTDGDGSSYDEWLEWEEFVSQHEGPGNVASNGPQHSYEALVCVTENVEKAVPSTKVRKERVVAPSMPCVPSDNDNKQRSKNDGLNNYLFQLLYLGQYPKRKC